MAVSTRVDVSDIDRKLVKPFMNTAAQIRKAERMAIKDALVSTRGRGRKRAAEEYAIKPAGKKKLFDSIKLGSENESTEQGTLIFKGGVGTKLRYFPGQPAKIPAVWLKKLGPDGKVVKKGLNPRLRAPVGGTSFKLKRAGGFKLKQGPKKQPTFWYYAPWINLAKHAGRKKSDALRVGYREKPTGGKMSEWGLFGPSLIQAVGRLDILKALREHARERYGVRLAHYLDAYLRGILK